MPSRATGGENFFEAAARMGYNMNNNTIPMQNNMQFQQYPLNPVSAAPAIPTPNTQIAVPSGGLGYGFTIVKDEEESTDKRYMLSNPIVNTIPDTIDSNQKRRGRPPKKNNKEIIKPDDASGEVVDESAMYTYSQTTMMLHETVQQIDMVAAEIKDELDNVKLSKTYRNKHNTMIGLSKSLADLLSSKVSAISQINNSISKANDLDYKREKDRKDRDAAAAMDDNTIMNMYNAFISNPYNTGGMNKVLGPSGIETTLNMNNIVRADVGTEPANSGMQDAGYLSYLANMTPEQNMMFYEQNPNVKTVVVYDAATGNKSFAVIDVTTGQNIPNVPVMDNRFLEDTYLDIKNRIARNNNLHESYPIVVLNENIMNEY